MRARVEALGPWFHNLELAGVATAPGHPLGDHPRAKFERFESVLPPSLAGWSVLDVGCNAGFYAFEMKRRGAERVVGVDHDEDYLAQARFASEVLGLDVEFRQLDVFGLDTLEERFDLVLFLGVLYHLRHPLLGLEKVRAVTRRAMLFQTLLIDDGPEITPHPDYAFDEIDVMTAPGWPRLHLVEHSFAGDCTNWFVPNRAGAKALARVAGFDVSDTPERDVFWCTP